MIVLHLYILSFPQILLFYVYVYKEQIIFSEVESFRQLKSYCLTCTLYNLLCIFYDHITENMLKKNVICLNATNLLQYYYAIEKRNYLKLLVGNSFILFIRTGLVFRIFFICLRILNLIKYHNIFSTKSMSNIHLIDI